MEYKKLLKKRFGRRLYTLYGESRLTKEQVAQKCETDVHTLECWFRGDSVPRLDKLLKIAYFFGVSLDELCALDMYISDRDEE